MSFILRLSSDSRTVGGRRAAVGATVLGLLLCAAGCRGVSKPPAPETARLSSPYERPLDDAVPPWLGETLSWEKLGRVEAWLANEGARATPQWRNEAELVLNSGRLEFARRELEQDAAKSAAVTSRLRSVKAGFERLALREDLNAGQRERVSSGAARAEKLLARAPVTKKLTNVAVVARADWGAQKAKPALMDRTLGAYTRITIHHSADNDPVVLDGSAARSFEAARDIQRAHMQGKETNYGDIGYHFVIDPYGRVLEGRDLTFQGAHAKGDNNVKNVGICLIGNFDETKPTEAALTALRRLVDDLRAKYRIPRTLVYGHRDLRGTRCPGENLTRWVTSYRGGPPAAFTAQAAAPRRPARSGR